VPREVARVLAAAHRADASVQVIVDPGVSETVTAVLAAGGGLGFPVSTLDDATFAAQLALGALDDDASARVRYVGSVPDATHEQLAGRPEVALLDDDVTASGRVELRFWLKEQALAMTLHRFGNPAPAFHALATELKG
jgi:RHH-type proline utilization regulon transcriptional repressor/proline dehydrogenase/delta 1-pyrroline-5-carboxylate dehydrogenase